MSTNFTDLSIKATNYVTDNSQRITKFVINTVMVVIVFAVTGCFDWLNLTFDISRLLTVSYWSKTSIKAISSSLLFNVGINLLFDKTEQNDVSCNEQKKKYEILNKTRDKPTFDTFITKHVNQELKKQAYINSISKKIYWLEKCVFVRNKDKLLYNSLSDIEEEQKELDIRKSKNWYCVKKAELEKLRSEEYVNKNLDNIHIKYNYIDPIVFDLDIECRVNHNGYKVKGSVAKGRAKKTSTGILSMIVIGMVTTSILMDASGSQLGEQMQSFWAYIVTMAIDFGTYLWQILRGMASCKPLVNSEITIPLTDRNTLLERYNNWCIANKIEKSKSYMIYNKILEEKERENNKA